MTTYNREMKGLTPPKWHDGYFKLRTYEQIAAEGGQKKKQKQKKTNKLPFDMYSKSF